MKPDVAHSLDYHRDFVLPVMSIIGLAASVIAVMLMMFSIHADNEELRTEQRAAGIAIANHLSEMKHYLSDCSAWDIGYSNLALRLNNEWANSNIGPYLFKTQGFENSFVIDKNDRTTYASNGATTADLDAFGFVGLPLRRAVESIRVGRAGSDRRIVGLTKTANGRVAAFAVAPIIPETEKIAQPSGGLSILVLVDALGSDDATHIGLVHQLQGLRLVESGKPAHLLLRNPEGEVVGGLTWTPRRPGAALRYGGAPIVGIVVTILILAARRILERARNAQAQVHRLAAYDSLTGLRNRTTFIRRLDGLVATATPFALLSIDLDRFKAVNDQYGHLLGDEVLVEISRRLSAQSAPGDILARIGGDEFVMLVSADVMRRTPKLVSSIIAVMKEPITTARARAYVGASIGVAFYPQDGSLANEVRQAADLALYRAKEQGHSGACFYSKDMDQAVHDRHLLEIALREALDTDEIDLAFQPVLATSTGRVTSFEALARWDHPTLGPVPPSDFISVAEECGLIEQLGTLLLRKACDEATTWPTSVAVAVNLSPLQFESGELCAIVCDVLAQTGLAPSCLQLEVTEGLLIRDVDRTFHQLEELRALGIKILIDDFGIGYSSLSYFERFRFDKVKVDRSFVSSIATSPASQAIVRAVVQLGITLEIDIVAEGVETSEQMELVAACGCTHVQGYFFSRPIRGNAIIPFLKGIGSSNAPIIQGIRSERVIPYVREEAVFTSSLKRASI